MVKTSPCHGEERGFNSLQNRFLVSSFKRMLYIKLCTVFSCMYIDSSARLERHHDKVEVIGSNPTEVVLLPGVD